MNGAQNVQNPYGHGTGDASGENPYGQAQYGQAQYGQAQYGQPPYGQAAPAAKTLTATEDRTWATLAHVVPGVAFVMSAGVLGFVASLVIYAIYKDRGPLVAVHARNSLNVQLTFLVYALASAALMLVLVGFLTMPLAYVYVVLMHVLAAVKAYNGEQFEPKFTIKFIK